jgi:hypothetical protein
VLVTIHVQIKGLEPPKHINQLFRGKVVVWNAGLTSILRQKSAWLDRQKLGSLVP